MDFKAIAHELLDALGDDEYTQIDTLALPESEYDAMAFALAQHLRFLADEGRLGRVEE